ncbi:hypothetical protein [Ferrovum myxofaciens]|uniref:Uncharacterized protein n=1 Tax=Ferrovum myxofaciens TaxID=416213 RepID=A0A9E6MXW6_9PROT|nr:hypothetical protein [Ferrovum myxofaciens]QKE37851.1 MAG: hypothetical protein HO273_03165 [Ferrovum myxofaciens]QWY75531.1 MAG: hypothetical protein JVY19_03610 [Ferrovum myxofaciens]QWY78269.1 MAG: hypothetical protein JZL65_04125 [Ferrovum myxofaciens]
MCKKNGIRTFTTPCPKPKPELSAEGLFDEEVCSRAIKAAARLDPDSFMSNLIFSGESDDETPDSLQILSGHLREAASRLDRAAGALHVKNFLDILACVTH